MTAILNVLVEVTVYSVILFGAVLLFQKLFHKHISAALNYAVWVLLIVRLIMPVTIDSGFHFFVMPEAPPQVQTDTVNNASNNAPSQAGLFLPVQQTIVDTSYEASTGNGISNRAGNDNQNLSAPWKIDWQTALVLAWGAGVIGSFTVMSVLWRRLGQKIKRYGSAAPEYVLKLVDECKNDMSIQANIEVLVQGWLKSPALSASLKPKLLLPEHMLHTMDAQQLEFGIRHELTHYRRKDHIMNILLMVLRCVYWFNPVVYIAFRRIQIDMETACDASITSRLESPERTSYIRTMIDLSGSSDTQYILGMGMGRKAIEKRIRGMFMKKKTGASVRTAAFVLAGILAVTCFTTACQPTPEKPVVVNKNDSALSDNIMAPPASAATYNASASVKDAFTAKDSHVTVNIDAAVTVPNVSAFPVVQIQPDKFTNDFVKKAAEVLFEGKTAYEPRTQMTKAEIEKEIFELQHALADPKNSGSDGLTCGDAEVVAETTQMFKDRINNYQALLATAPDTVTAKESDFQFRPAKTYEDPAMYKEQSDGWKESGNDNQANELLDQYENGQELMVDATLDNGYYGRIEATNYSGSAMIDNSLYFLKSKTLNPNILCGPTYGFDAEIPPTSLSQEDAFQMSQNLLDQLGITNMALTSCSTITSDSPVLINIGFVERQAASQQSDEKYGYCLTYKRTYGGIPTMVGNTLYEKGDARLSNDDQYGPYYQHEYIQITIYGDQIVSFIWQSPSKEAQTENANVELKPFNDIMDAFKQQMSVEYTLEKLSSLEAYNNYQEDSIAKMDSGHVDISKIGLEMVRIQIKDKPGEYRMVPAWRFYGNVKIKWKDGQEEEQANMAGIIGNPLTVCQTINAIDGSIIDEKLGY